MPNELTPFTLANIHTLDKERYGKAVDLLIKKAIEDCLDRPGDDRPRKLTMQMSFVPVTAAEGRTIECEGAKVVGQAKLAIPNFETKVVDIGVKSTGHGYFNEANPEDHRQGTLPFPDPDSHDDPPRAA